MTTTSGPAAPVLFAATTQRNDPDERFTPRWVFDALGEVFDLDVASPTDQTTYVPARAVWTRVDDGLVQPWHGFVWCNPPFSRCTAFADRFQQHANGLWLGPIANAAWLHRMAKTATLAWWMKDFAFVHPTHAGRRSSMPLAMFAFGDRAAAAIRRAAAALPDAGTVVKREEH